MKVKLLKRLRKKYNRLLRTTYPKYYGYGNKVDKIFLNAHIKIHINKYKLWYKLLTTITHKKEWK